MNDERTLWKEALSKFTDKFGETTSGLPTDQMLKIADVLATEVACTLDNHAFNHGAEGSVMSCECGTRRTFLV